MAIQFHPSFCQSIGLELEVQLIDRHSKDLVSLAPQLLAQLPEEGFKWELFQCTVEINSSTCRSVPELEIDLKQKLALLAEIADAHGAELLLSGTHPFAHWRTQKITESQRYQKLLDRIRWPVRQFLIFGLHIHVGVTSAAQVIRLLNATKPYIPHLIALSASSPFWIGFDTGLASSRVKIFEALPNAGLPPSLPNWKAFQHLLHIMLKSKSVESIRDIWWDVRPHAYYGTLEIRICDLMPTLKENLALAALAFCLIEFLKETSEPPVSQNHAHQQWILAQNKWRATRYGLEARLITANNGEVPIRQEIEALLTQLQPIARKHQMEGYWSTLSEILSRGASYCRQRQWFYSHGKNPRALVDFLQQEFSTNAFIKG